MKEKGALVKEDDSKCWQRHLHDWVKEENESEGYRTLGEHV